MNSLDKKTVYFLGKLAAFNRKDAARFVQRHGGKTVKTFTADVQILVAGEGGGNTDWEQLNETTQEAFENGTLEIITEHQFLERCGERTESTGTLYTPSMLAELSGLPLGVIRQLERRQVFVPARYIYELPYFRFDVLSMLNVVRCMLNAGLTMTKIVSILKKTQRSILKTNTGIRVAGNDVLYQTDGGIVDGRGQYCFSFAAEQETERNTEPLKILDSIFEDTIRHDDVDALCEAAQTLEEDGDLTGAANCYRAALAAGGADAKINFRLGEVLYRLGDLPAARERCYTAIEIDETLVEARFTLGCILAEQGDDKLAAAAFRGALRFHPDYADARKRLEQLLQG
ncbi:MAG: tetratricopeptide repeat protein [Planctomycetaceae bacterium]|jgi:DNA-binding transcriptional MerR regulator|nr:tetratricopeptide repeat protein [Planctomycetaceae bacterium]